MTITTVVRAKLFSHPWFTRIHLTYFSRSYRTRTLVARVLTVTVNRPATSFDTDPSCCGKPHQTVHNLTAWSLVFFI